MLDLVTLFRGAASLCWALAASRLLLAVLARQSGITGRWGLSALTVAGAVFTALGLFAAASALDPGSAWSTAALLATETWGGRMAMLRLGLATAAALLALLRADWATLAALLVVCAALFLIPFSGHAVTAEPVRVSLLLHGLHVYTVLLWAGGVINLAALSLGSSQASITAALLRAFSPVALTLVIVGIVSGLAAGYLQAGAGAALLGNFYGQLLLLKCLLLFGVGFPCAAWLRWRYLARHEANSPRLVLLAEAATCLALIATATLLSQSVPARHSDVVWPLPFRLDFSVLKPERDGAYVLLGHLIFGAVMLAVAGAAAMLRNWMLALITGSMGLLIGILGLLNMVIPAFPTTFVTLQSSYSVETLASSEAVFMDNCARCHGGRGHGDGPDMQASGKRAADLTVHAAQHTPGDIYWWITHGVAGSAMPGFENAVPDQQRWDLVNYLKLISYGVRSKAVTGEVTPRKPFLPSMDFAFASEDGKEARLRDLEGQKPVLLVIDDGSAFLPRLRQLQAEVPELSTAGLVVIIAAPQDVRQQLTSGPSSGLFWVPAGDLSSVSGVWRHYAGMPLSEAGSPHSEFLIDRFGYVRAKWNGKDQLLPNSSRLLELAAELANEPRILPSPEEHVH